MHPKLTVFIIDDDQTLCNSLQWLLVSIGLQVEIFHSAEAFLKKFDINRRGCLILDVRMSGMSGTELQLKLNSQFNQMPIIFLSGYGDIPLVVNAMRAGALDFISKPFNAQNLLDRVQEALAIDKQRSVPLDTSFIDRLGLLTLREKQTLELVVIGKRNKQIADELKISTKTVELHRSKVMQKLQVVSLAELIKLYFMHMPQVKG